MVDKRISELDAAGPLTGDELVELSQEVGGELESVQAPLQAIVQQLALQGPQGDDGPQGLQGQPGAPGADGDNGWSPILASANDGARRVLQVSGWTGGAGTPPASGKYVGPSGLVDAIADAVDVRGAQGPQGSQGDPGDQGPQGNPGTPGSNGGDGWSPAFAIINDGARRVLKVTSWSGGSGTPPASNLYVGVSGLVSRHRRWHRHPWRERRSRRYRAARPARRSGISRRSRPARRPGTSRTFRWARRLLARIRDRQRRRTPRARGGGLGRRHGTEAARLPG